MRWACTHRQGHLHGCPCTPLIVTVKLYESGHSGRIRAHPGPYAVLDMNEKVVSFLKVFEGVGSRAGKRLRLAG